MAIGKYGLVPPAIIQQQQKEGKQWENLAGLAQNEWAPSTTVTIDRSTGQYTFNFPYAGAENYGSYMKIIEAHPELPALRAFTSPTLNVDLAFADSQGRRDIMVQWLQGMKGSPTGGPDLMRGLQTVAGSPWVQASLMFGGSAAYGVGRTAAEGYLVASGSLRTLNLFRDAELGVGAYFGVSAAKGVYETYKQQGLGAGIGTGVSTLAIFAAGAAGFSVGKQMLFTRGLPEGATGYTSGEWGGHKGTLKNIRVLEAAGKDFGGKTTYQPAFRTSSFIGSDLRTVTVKTPIGDELVSLSPEQAGMFRTFENFRFQAQGMYGRTPTYIGMRGLVGQSDFDVGAGKAETMASKPSEYVDFVEKQSTMTGSERFGGSTYKASGAHDVDEMVGNLSQFTRRAEFGASKLGVSPEDLGVDIKPMVKPGKMITTSGSLKLSPYNVPGEFGDVDVMRWSETAARLGDASKMPTSRRIAWNPESGLMEAKDINSYLNTVARLHYQAGSPNTFDMKGFLESGSNWEKNFVRMGTASESRLFDTKTLGEKWASAKNIVYRKVLPENIQNYFQEKNFNKIMNFNSDFAVGESRGMSDVPGSPSLPSSRFNILFTSSFFGPIRSSSSIVSPSISPSPVSSYVSPSPRSSRVSPSPSRSFYPSSLSSPSPSPSPIRSFYPSPPSPSLSPSPSRYTSPSPSPSPSRSTSGSSVYSLIADIPGAVGGGGSSGRGGVSWNRYFRKRTFKIGSIEGALGVTRPSVGRKRRRV